MTLYYSYKTRCLCLGCSLQESFLLVWKEKKGWLCWIIIFIVIIYLRLHYYYYYYSRGAKREVKISFMILINIHSLVKTYKVEIQTHVPLLVEREHIIIALINSFCPISIKLAPLPLFSWGKACFVLEINKAYFRCHFKMTL